VAVVLCLTVLCADTKPDCFLQVEKSQNILDMIAFCTDTWSKRAAERGAPLCNAMLLLPGGGSVFADVINLEGDVKTGR